MGEMRNAYQIFVEKPEGKRPAGIHRRRWEGSIKMNLTEIGLEGVDWIHLAQDRDQWRTLVNMIMNLMVLQKPGNFLTSSVTISFHGVSYLL
jgi:hypothetical protein